MDDDVLETRLRALADDVPAPARPLERTLAHGRRRQRRATAARLTGALSAVAVLAVVGVAVVRGRGPVPDGEVLAGAGDPTVTGAPSAGSPPVVVRSLDAEGRCVQVAVPAVSAEACLTVPGTSLWKVGDAHLVVARGALVVDGIEHDAGPGEGAVAVPYAPGRLAPHERCLDPTVADALVTQLSSEAVAHVPVSCSDDVQFVVVLPRRAEVEPETRVVVRTGDRWQVRGRLEDTACDSLPGSGPEQCRMAGAGGPIAPPTTG